jgi:hypothetical protein
MVLMILLSMFIFHRPCVYCAILVIGFLTASCESSLAIARRVRPLAGSIDLSPPWSPVHQLTSRCWLDLSSYSDLLLPSTFEDVSRNVTTNATKPLDRLVGWVRTLPSDYDLEWRGLGAHIYWGLSTPPEFQRAKRVESKNASDEVATSATTASVQATKPTVLQDVVVKDEL